VERAEQYAFIASIAPAAKAAAVKFRVPASVSIAQAILESAWGQSHLSRQANNYFGIKASTCGQDYLDLPTTEILTAAQLTETLRQRPWVTVIAKMQLGADRFNVRLSDRFRKYASPAECFLARGEMISSEPRYAPAIADADDALVFAARLQQCGYSTDPQYAAKLARLMAEFRLAQYDDCGRGDGEAETATRDNQNVSGAAESGESSGRNSGSIAAPATS
jgi:flagellum-specific peptidoglycan hydrolase FlgJ